MKTHKLVLIVSVILIAIAVTSCSGGESHNTYQVTTNKATETPITTQEDTEFQTGTKNAVKITRDQVEVYATQSEPENGLYTDFLLKVNGCEKKFTGKSTQNFDAKIFVEDLTSDGFPDVVISLSMGGGTGISMEDVHIFDGISLDELSIENIPKTLGEHISFSSDDSAFYINTDNKTYQIEKSKLESDKEFLFDAIVTGMVYSWSVKDGILICNLSCQVATTEHYGSIEVFMNCSENGFVYGNATFIDHETEGE